MENNAETFDMPDDAIRQYIDARQTFLAYEQALARVSAYRGGMFWKTVKQKEYLIRTTPRGAQTSLGAKTPETIEIYQKFVRGKTREEQSAARLREAVEKHARLNRALRVGRTPSIVINLLAEIERAGLAPHFAVVGTHALYAYETAASVRIVEAALATRDLDLLWDNRKKISLGMSTELSKDGMIGLLRKVDASFRINPLQLYTAVNDDGFEVDIIRAKDPARTVSGDKDGPARLSEHDDDFWTVKARNAEWLLSAPRFKEMVVGSTGAMACMNTIDPRAFVLFKLWMAEQKDREYGKRLRDANQARIVLKVIEERLPQLSFENIKIFPSAVKELLDKVSNEDHPIELPRPARPKGW